MANIIVSVNSANITSKFKTEELLLLKKRNRDALTMKDKDGNPIFAINVGAQSSVSPDGIVFGATTRDGKGNAVAALEIPASVGNTEAAVKAWVLDTVGNAIIKLNKLEETLGAALEAVASETKAVEDSISIAG